MVRIGVINVSDRASAGVYEDTPGKACVALLREWLSTPFEVEYKVVPDEQPKVVAWGRYQDRLVRQGSAWRFSERICVTEANLL